MQLFLKSTSCHLWSWGPDIHTFTYTLLCVKRSKDFGKCNSAATPSCRHLERTLSGHPKAAETATLTVSPLKRKIGWRRTSTSWMGLCPRQRSSSNRLLHVSSRRRFCQLPAALRRTLKNLGLKLEAWTQRSISWGEKKGSGQRQEKDRAPGGTSGWVH